MKNYSIFSISLGNLLEWFDFALLIYFAPIIGKVFFSESDTTSAMLMVFSVFALGFICRPLGGIIFGYLGDRIGRVKTLRVSMLFMACALIGIGLLPSYIHWGIYSPILFILARLLQGLSAGGEYCGVMIYLSEIAPPEKRGIFTSLGAVGSNMGFLFAMLSMSICAYFFSEYHGIISLWRLFFLAGGTFGLIIFLFRLNLSETKTYQTLTKNHKLERYPLLYVIKYYPSLLIKILGLTCMGTSLYYTFFAYIPNYLRLKGGGVATTSLNDESIFLFLMLFFIPFFAWCGDRFGRKKMLLTAALGIILCSIPCFYLIQTQHFLYALLAFFIAVLLSSIEQANNLVTMIGLSPPQVRYSSIAFSYNLGNALFGGTAPLILTLLVTKFTLYAAAYYLIGMATLSLLTILTLPAQSK